MKPAALHRQRWLVAAFATCLVLAQALWLLHRVAHVGIATQVSAASSHHKAGLWAKSVLPDHQDERSCAQYDHFSHADMAVGGELMEATQLHPLLAQATHVASQMAAQAAGFLARGPPAIA
jgi:hypothetical protein